MERFYWNLHRVVIEQGHVCIARRVRRSSVSVRPPAARDVGRVAAHGLTQIARQPERGLFPGRHAPCLWRRAVAVLGVCGMLRRQWLRRQLADEQLHGRWDGFAVRPVGRFARLDASAQSGRGRWRRPARHGLKHRGWTASGDGAPSRRQPNGAGARQRDGQLVAVLRAGPRGMRQRLASCARRDHPAQAVANGASAAAAAARPTQQRRHGCHCQARCQAR